MVGGIIIYNRHNGSEVVNENSDVVNEEIEICNIFEYGDSVYYVLPEENDPYNAQVICKMKKDGTNKEVFLNKTPGNMRVYENYLFDGKYRINLDTNEEKCYSYDNIIYMNNEIMIYQKANGFGVANMKDIDNWSFDEKVLVLGEKSQDWSILYVDGNLVIYSANENLYTIRISELNSNQQGKFLIAEGNYAKFLTEKDGEVYFYVNEDENIHLYRFNKETEELKCVLTDTLDSDLVGILDNREIGNIAIKDETILYTIGSYQGSAGMWCGSTIKINKDGTGKEVLEEFNESDLVKNVDDRLYYEVFSQDPSVWYWNEYVNGKSLRIDDFKSVEKGKYKFTENKDKVIISQLYAGEYKECITIPKKNKELDFVSGEIKEVGEWLYVDLYEHDSNGSSWRGFNHLECYRISKDYKVIQALDDNYVIKNPYSKLLSLNNVRLKNDLNVRIKLSFVPYGNNADLNEGITSGKYVIETFCQANENADKLEIEDVLFSGQSVNLIFDDYDFDKNPDFIFEYINSSNATENIKYEVSENAKLENIKKKGNNEIKKEISLRNYDSIDMDLLKLENKEENMVYSPLSIKYALGMLREGASDEMKAKINKVIGDNFEPSKRINSKNYSLANGLFIRNSIGNEVKTEFINNAQYKYQADVVLDDFSDAETINGWINDKTFGILDQVMTDNEISGLDVALVNTVAIDMDWESRFWHGEESSDLIEMKFNRVDNSEKKVLGLYKRFCIDKFELPEGFFGDEYMPYPDIYMTDEYYKETGETFSYKDERGSSMYQDAKVNVISQMLKEYDEKKLEFIAIMPKQQSLKEYIKDFSGQEFNKILINLNIDSTKEGYETVINAEFPKFQFEYNCDLKESLNTLGLKEMFDRENNDFEKIMDSFYINIAKQNTQIDVNEEGIKAASVTVVGGCGGGGLEVPSVYVNIIIDRPFLFFIIDNDTKEVVFTGTVYEPTDYEIASQSIKGL